MFKGHIRRWSSVVSRSGCVVRLKHANDQRLTTDDCLPTKNRRDQPTLMVPETGKECQSRRSTYRLRKCTCQENRSILSPCASRTHQEHNVLPALERRLDLDKVVRIVHGLLVHFEDYVAALQ